MCKRQMYKTKTFRYGVRWAIDADYERILGVEWLNDVVSQDPLKRVQGLLGRCSGALNRWSH